MNTEILEKVDISRSLLSMPLRTSQILEGKKSAGNEFIQELAKILRYPLAGFTNALQLHWQCQFIIIKMGKLEKTLGRQEAETQPQITAKINEFRLTLEVTIKEFIEYSDKYTFGSCSSAATINSLYKAIGQAQRGMKSYAGGIEMQVNMTAITIINGLIFYFSDSTHDSEELIFSFGINNKAERQKKYLEYLIASQ